MAETTPAPAIGPCGIPDVDATVLICTYNRATYLADTLDSLAHIPRNPGFTWDVLVVDNNSSDGTRGVVNEHVANFPVRLRYLFEATQGKSNALNTGMSAACSSIIVFTDDDVKVDQGWLQAAVLPLLERIDIDYTGGPVRPIWSAPPPSWLDEKGNLGGTIAVKDHGNESFIFEDQRKTPLGVNMAVKRRLIERIGGFRPDLGRNGKALLGQEQAEFFYRSRGAGGRGLYVPAMILDHVVPASRLTRSYFRRWWYWKGVSHARVHRIHACTELGVDITHVPRMFGVPRFVISNLIRHVGGWLASWVPPSARARAEHWLAIAYLIGYCREVWWPTTVGLPAKKTNAGEPVETAGESRASVL